jgi:RHH-type rel operon transcriptional repressor/antitoxin RelB
MGGTHGLFFEVAAVVVDAGEEKLAGRGVGADRFGAEMKPLSIRIDSNTNEKLDALARRSKRSKSFLAAEAITAYVDAEAWQLGEIEAGLTDLDEGKTVSHDKVTKWLSSWGKRSEHKPPR